MTVVKIGLAQINTTAGDVQGNADKIAGMARQAAAQGADLLLTPELSIAGYPPEDLLLRPEFLRRQNDALERLARGLAAHEGLRVVVGHAHEEDGVLYNAAAVLFQGGVAARYCKGELPAYGVFDEKRYFQAGAQALVLEIKGLRFALNICEDAWLEAHPRRAAQAGAQVLLVINASPYSVDKQAQRLERLAATARGMPVVYLNQVGGQDELVFDGASFVLDAQGAVARRLPAFEERLELVSFDGAGRPLADAPAPPWPDRHEQVYQALVLALRDYVGKSGFPDVILGLSGGVDSALVMAVAVDALGPSRVRAVMMPSRYTAGISLEDARAMAGLLQVRYDEIGIAGLAAAFDTALAPQFQGLAPDLTEENIQARVRGVLLMAMSNKFGPLVLTTGNKSELATGYCTLYGDMAGGFALLKDVPKTLVYALCRWRNRQSPVIPERIIDRPPSAELRDDQTDQDSLPPYEILDAIIELYVERDTPARDIVAAGYDPDVVDRVLRLIRGSEYKRRQGAVGPKITARAFGRDWRYPITNGFRE